jgi:hypothetical protein
MVAQGKFSVEAQFQGRHFGGQITICELVDEFQVESSL